MNLKSIVAKYDKVTESSVFQLAPKLRDALSGGQPLEHHQKVEIVLLKDQLQLSYREMLNDLRAAGKALELRNKDKEFFEKFYMHEMRRLGILMKALDAMRFDNHGNVFVTDPQALAELASVRRTNIKGDRSQFFGLITLEAIEQSISTLNMLRKAADILEPPQAGVVEENLGKAVKPVVIAPKTPELVKAKPLQQQTSLKAPIAVLPWFKAKQDALLKAKQLPLVKPVVIAPSTSVKGSLAEVAKTDEVTDKFKIIAETVVKELRVEAWEYNLTAKKLDVPKHGIHLEAVDDHVKTTLDKEASPESAKALMKGFQKIGIKELEIDSNNINDIKLLLKEMVAHGINPKLTDKTKGTLKENGIDEPDEPKREAPKLR